MALLPFLVLLLALPSHASGKQPATAEGAVAAAEKLAPKTTPIGMVIGLLKDLTVKVEAQGKAEAAAYDKYACFCKEQADEKLYSIENADKKVKELSAKIEDLEAALSDLAEDIRSLSGKIESAEKSISKLDIEFAESHLEYSRNSGELQAAISACELAGQALKDSKAAMEGKTQTGAALLQVRAAASAASRRGIVVLTADQKAALDDLASGGAHKATGPTDGEAYAAKFHSNEIMQLIDDLRNKFIEEKNNLDTQEFESKKLYDNLRLSHEKDKQFAELEKAERERVSAEKTAKKEIATEDRYVTDRSGKQDQEFLDVLTGECQEKAVTWDQRSKQRAQELTALGDATEALESGAAPNFKANKKLVDLQAPSFLQLRGHGRQDRRQRVMGLLGVASARLHSSVLAMASLRVQASDDHFVKVRQLMKDLVARLEDEQSREASQKKICDEAIGKAVAERDSFQSTFESESQDKAIKTAESKQLAVDIAELSEQIAANKRAVMEATELRTAESAENSMTVAEAEEGLAAVKKAIEILETFYTQASTALLQRSKSGAHQPFREDELAFRSNNSDSEGNTVADLAPDAFDDTYKGQQEASSGIIGTLQVIQSDFERTILATKDAEKGAKEDFVKLSKEIDEDTLDKQGDEDTKNSKLTVVSDAILTLETQLGDSKKMHELAEGTLEKLRSSCVEKEETYEERVAKREQEIEALKEAHAILEDWESQ